jgi:hypothetical protein
MTAMEWQVSRQTLGVAVVVVLGTHLSQARLTGAVVVLVVLEAIVKKRAIGRGTRPRVGKRGVAERVQWY